MKSDRIYRQRVGFLKLFLHFSLFFLALSCQSDSSITPEIILESKPLEELIAEIETGTYGEIHSLLISKNDTLIMEQYFNGYERDHLHRLYSVTKSITSALIGIALSQEKIKTLENNVLNSFTEYSNIANLDSRKKAITIEDLLTMSAGFTWDESSTSYDSHANDAFKLGRSSDWMKHMLDLPMRTQPGTEFVYNSGGTMLLSGIIRNATGMTAENFAQSYIFEFLGISNWNWRTGPNQITNTGWGLDLRPRDMLKFGELYLKKGVYHNVQIVPQNWITQSTETKISAGPNYNYAYQWWRFSDTSSIGMALKINDLFFAWGYGGQFIFVMPHLNTVVVSNGGNFENSSIAFDFLEDYILAAVKSD